MKYQVDYRSWRSRQARISVRLTKGWRAGLFVFALALLLGGAALLVGRYTLGWMVMGLAAWPAMVLAWYRGHLQALPPLRQPTSVDGYLAGEVLGRLGPDADAVQLARVVMATPGGWFFEARFGVGGASLQEIATVVTDLPAIWQRADQIRQQLGLDHLPPGVLVVAIVSLHPAAESILATAHLTVDDLVTGARWQQHLYQIAAEHKQRRRTGGVARDWSFGFIPILSRFGQNISEQIARGGLLVVPLESHQAALDQTMTALASGGRRNAVLVGGDGAGKTTVVQALAEKLLNGGDHSVPRGLRFSQVFLLDAASIVAAAPGRGETERLVNTLLGEAFAAKNIIVCLDNAHMFFEDGVGSVDISNLLVPVLEAGRLPIIMTIDEQHWLSIAARHGSLANAINRVTIAPATRDETMAVLQDQVILFEFRHKVTYRYHALVEAYRLSERYVHDLAMPGRALKLLETAASYSHQGLVTDQSVQAAIEKTMDIKLSAAGDDERAKLLDMEQLIHQRMINQTRAVAVVADALRRARAGVRNQERPIGTFLFLGPTGVGKTELAKALADVYFGGEDRMIRLDLNEFVRPDDVARLIADGARDGGSLTAQIMRQPFSVVLLDEIEKAAPEVLATLLQVLDEGILRDETGREVSFRDAIIIATSNAGADRIRDYIDQGYKLDQFEQQFVDELINSGQFRPEFLNRFDEIVVFRPLEKPELLQVIDLMIAGVNRTLAAQKITVQVDDPAKELLVDHGYDPRLGARPMRRMVQRAVENVVARHVLAGSVASGGTVTVTRAQVAAALGVEEAPSGVQTTRP